MYHQVLIKLIAEICQLVLFSIQYKIHYSLTSKAENKINNVTVLFNTEMQGDTNVADFQLNPKVYIDQ